MACIYKITNDINGKMYVGKTAYNAEKRWKEHCDAVNHHNKQHYPLYRAIKKYGINCFSIEEIEECPEEALSERECYWISRLDTYHKGYNATLGGDGNHNVDHDRVLKEYRSLKSVQRVADKMKIDPKTVSTILYWNNIDTGYRHGVEMLSKDGETIGKFESVSDAAKYIVWLYERFDEENVRKRISKVCDRPNETAYSFVWRSFRLNEGGDWDGSETEGKTVG